MVSLMVRGNARHSFTEIKVRDRQSGIRATQAAEESMLTDWVTWVLICFQIWHRRKGIDNIQPWRWTEYTMNGEQKTVVGMGLQQHSKQ